MKNILSTLLLATIFHICTFAQESTIIETKHGTLHYKTFGSGEPILIINGGPGLDCEGFEPLAELLSDKYMCILFDQRGTGKSELNVIDSNTVTMDLMVEDIETIRKHLKINKWVVLGHSFGGWMAGHYASIYPDPIKGMILSSTGGIDLDILNYVNDNIIIRLSQQEKDSLNYWNDKIYNGDTTIFAKHNKMKYLASAYMYYKKYVPALQDRLTYSGNKQVNSLVFKNLFAINFDLREPLKDFSQPVLIIQGRQDMTGDGVAYEVHNALQNSKLVFINKCSHYSWLEQSKQYKTEVDSFIKSINSN